MPTNWYAWGKFHDRFNVAKEPNEANRFGWVVEIDPFDPTATPKKRTALGRAKHEGAAGIINTDGRYVVYTGDDERFDYVYRFVTNARVDRANPAANRDILDDGVLSVARYNADGTARLAAAGARAGAADRGERLRQPGRCPDRNAPRRRLARRHQDGPPGGRRGQPGDAEGLCDPHQQRQPQARAGRRRQSARRQSLRAHHRDDPAGRRSRGGAIPLGNAGASAAIPSVAAVGAAFSSATTSNGWFGMPDNVAFDSQGRMWVATDGQSKNTTGRADGLWGVETEGAARGTSRHFYRVPVGAELCGPCFTPDDETLFVAVQHPARGGILGRALELRGAVDALAGFQSEHAAAPVGRRHHQARRRQDRDVEKFLLAISSRTRRVNVRRS